MPSILHLSDLHFGLSLKKPHDTKLQNVDGAKHLAEKIYRTFTMTPFPDTNMPCAIVVTGDLVNEPDASTYELAEQFLSELLDWFDLGNDKIIIVPGNHDIKWDVPSLETGSQYAGYKAFFEKVKKSKKHTISWMPNKPDIVEFDVDNNGNKGVIFGFNSCTVEHKLWRGLGYIDGQQFTNVIDWLSTRDSTKYVFRIAALHHHLFPVHDYKVSYNLFSKAIDSAPEVEKYPPPVSVMLNTCELVEKCHEMGISLVLHGHTHSQFIANKTRFFQPYSDTAQDHDNMNNSIVVVGCGSVSQSKLDEFSHTQFQQISINRVGQRSPFISITPFVSKTGGSILDGARHRRQIVVPLTTSSLEIEPADIEGLHNTLNRITNLGYTDQIYDRLMESFVEWINATFNIYIKCATFAKFKHSINAYVIRGKHGYVGDGILNIAYDYRTLDQRIGITIKAARENKSIIVEERSKCSFASEKYNELYSPSIGGRDQSVIAIPLNSANETIPYGVLSFARPYLGPESVFSSNQKAVFEYVADIVEDAFRRADMIVYKERQEKVSMDNFRQLIDIDRCDREFIAHTEITNALKRIVDVVKNYFKIDITKSEAVGIALPMPSNNDFAIMAASVGFRNPDDMKYNITNPPSGLAGGVIFHQRPDYSIGHLREDKKSELLGSVSSKSCRKGDDSGKIDYQLSFVGVPLGLGKGKFDRGVLELNISTPKTIALYDRDEPNRYMHEKYIYPMSIIARIIEPVISIGWVRYCESYQVSIDPDGKTSKKNKIKKSVPK